jgi:hypothetical protein
VPFKTTAIDAEYHGSTTSAVCGLDWLESTKKPQLPLGEWANVGVWVGFFSVRSGLKK